MITLHRLGHAVDTFQINPDPIMTIEATPDTVITILNGQKIVVAEPPARVAEMIATYRARCSPRRSSCATSCALSATSCAVRPLCGGPPR